MRSGRPSPPKSCQNLRASRGAYLRREDGTSPSSTANFRSFSFPLAPDFDGIEQAGREWIDDHAFASVAVHELCRSIDCAPTGCGRIGGGSQPPRRSCNGHGTIRITAVRRWYSERGETGSLPPPRFVRPVSPSASSRFRLPGVNVAELRPSDYYALFAPSKAMPATLMDAETRLGARRHAGHHRLARRHANDDADAGHGDPGGFDPHREGDSLTASMTPRCCCGLRS